MKFVVIHEARIEMVVEAASEREAEEIAAGKPYAEWDRTVVVREECVPLEESPLNPHAGG
jgi:hypothetical protein